MSGLMGCCAAAGSTWSEGPGPVALVGFTLAEALADFVAFPTLVAATVTVLGLGTALGAVNRPVFEMEPTVEFPPTTPLTNHRTLVS
jgi:hypothetical protein